MSDRFAKAFELLRNGKVSDLLIRAGNSAQEHHWLVWLTTMAIMYSAGTPPSLYLPALENLFFSLAEPSDVAALMACTGCSDIRLSRLFDDWFAAGHVCATARDETAIVGYVWAFTDEYVLTLDDYQKCSLPIAIEQGAIFTGTGFVHEAYRNRTLFRQLKYFLMQQYGTGTRFYSAINTLNLPSLKASDSLGFVPVAHLRFAGFGNRSSMWFQDLGSRGWRAAGMSWQQCRARLVGDRFGIESR